ncbi:phage minor head protein [Streptomyces salinarius]|uniref:phage minor head protein n=1 Tax=Streptomyces salinarius TaxID=2762598 RepID=UPI002852B55F|nr:phage minor head protein [Streptomyces salinarius]
MADDWEAALTAAEEDVAAEVRAVLDEVAAEFAADLEAATEIVAARFSVSRIAGMWASRVPRLVRRLFRVVETAAEDAAESVDTPLPDGWDDLPGRYDDDTLPPSLGDYAETTEHLLRAVGDRLADRAVQALAEGLDEGEDVEALRARLRAVFDTEGAQLGETREERIARTESARAWNTATLAAAQELSGPDRPLVKQWRTRGDTLVRDAHDDADGQLRLLDEPFTVAGVQMSAPGDPTAPPELVINCRCVLRLERAPEQTAATDPGAPHWLRQAPAETRDRIAAFSGWPTQSKPAARATSEIPSQIGPEITASAGRIADNLTTAFAPELAAASAGTGRRYRFAWDTTPIPVLAAPEVTAAAVEHSGGMIALLPTEEDAERLALDDGETAGELHCTAYYLGEDASQWNEDQRNELINGVRTRAASLDGPVRARLFGVNHWNPQGDDPVWVWAVSDDSDSDGPGLQEARYLVQDALEDTHERPDIPRQHSPWVAHVTGVYTSETWPLDAMADRLGEITFDRVRVAFAGEYTDIPLGPEEEPPMDEQTAATVTAALPTRAWSTPGDTALAFENQQTGDGRIFAAGALAWDGPGPWPLQYADEMLMGHEGAELAGAIYDLGRDGDRIPGNGVLYLSQRAGAEAAMLLEQEAPLGVSVDLDDVDVEFVARNVDEDEPGLILASIPAASVLRMADGAWCITASNTTSLAASSTTDDGATFTRTRRTAQIFTSTSGAVTADAVRELAATGTLTAAAGDADDPEDGIVVHAERSGDFLVRITRARLRGATLVTVPAFANARIVLDSLDDEEDEATAAAVTAATNTETYERVVDHVRMSPVPLSPSQVARALGITVEQTRAHLGRAVSAGRLLRLGPGQYTCPSTLPEGPGQATASADGSDGMDVLVASAWTAMRDLPPMPAQWFAEPTEEELPPGSGGVHYAGGRIYGWVAQRGVPHAGYPGKNLTIEKLAKAPGLDFTHFLRARFPLDDGTTVKAGAFTMNAGHHRDGAECETAVCQFDDSRTVAAIITVGMSKGGLWFSGAAAPWLSAWDRTVFLGCQPSYHLNQGRGGKWELRAVLSVPVPGHSSPLLAAAIERANMALCASAAIADGPSAPTDATPSAPVDGPSAPADRTPTDQAGRPSAPPSAPTDGPSADLLAEALVAALDRPEFMDRLVAAVDYHQTAQEERRAEIARLAADLEDTTDTVTASVPAGDEPKGNH